MKEVVARVGLLLLSHWPSARRSNKQQWQDWVPVQYYWKHWANTSPGWWLTPRNATCRDGPCEYELQSPSGKHILDLSYPAEGVLEISHSRQSVSLAFVSKPTCQDFWDLLSSCGIGTTIKWAGTWFKSLPFSPVPHLLHPVLSCDEQTPGISLFHFQVSPGCILCMKTRKNNNSSYVTPVQINFKS